MYKNQKFTIDTDYILIDEPKVEMYVSQEEFDLICAEWLMRIFPRAQVPGMVIRLCSLIEYNFMKGF